MTVLFLLLTLCALGAAWVTFTSGLPQFAAAMAASVLSGLALMMAGYPPAGFFCFACTLGLMLYSKRVMQQHRVGPYREDESEPYR